MDLPLRGFSRAIGSWDCTFSSNGTADTDLKFLIQVDTDL
jgi:hypothetical protein